MRIWSVDALAAAWFCALGGMIGSFLNVVAYRVPLGRSVVFGRSYCPTCGQRIGLRDNIPVLGWLFLKGRCRLCSSAISPRYPLVEGILAGTFLLFYFAELISGGMNIPLREPNYYRGVTWILLETKWDIVPSGRNSDSKGAVVDLPHSACARFFRFMCRWLGRSNSWLCSCVEDGYETETCFARESQSA
ncbi:MAG: prepilin peptidase [Planctomycetota bacterium]|nr:MAG: prepilin peptidase [Planctomycetota bacterium]